MSLNETPSAQRYDVDALTKRVKNGMHFAGVSVEKGISAGALVATPRIKVCSDLVVRVWLRQESGAFDREEGHQVMEVVHVPSHNLAILVTPCDVFVLDATALHVEVSHGAE